MIVLSHRPIYCSDVYNTIDCNKNFLYLKPVYDLFLRYKVDLILSSHEHFYERRTPQINFEDVSVETVN